MACRSFFLLFLFCLTSCSRITPEDLSSAQTEMGQCALKKLPPPLRAFSVSYLDLPLGKIFVSETEEKGALVFQELGIISFFFPIEFRVCTLKDKHVATFKSKKETYEISYGRRGNEVYFERVKTKHGITDRREAKLIREDKDLYSVGALLFSNLKKWRRQGSVKIFFPDKTLSVAQLGVVRDKDNYRFKSPDERFIMDVFYKNEVIDRIWVDFGLGDLVFQRIPL